MRKLFRVFNSNAKMILKYGLAALLLTVPLYPKFPLFSVPGTYVAIRAEDFIIIFVGLVWAIYILSAKQAAFLLKNKLTQAILIYWGVGFLSVLSAIFLTKTVSSHIALLHWARRIEYMLPLLIAYSVTQKIDKSRFFAQCLFVGVFFVFLFGWGQIHLGLPVITTQNEEYSKGLALRWISGARLGSTFAGHYDLSAFLVMLLPLSTTLFFYYKKLKNRMLFLTFSVLPAFWLMLKAESRVSFVALLFGVSVALWVFNKKRYVVPIVLLAILGAVFLSNLGARYRLGVKTYWERLIKVNISTLIVPSVSAAQKNSASPERQRSKELENNQTQPAPAVLEDRSAAIRLNIEWPRAIRAFAKNPLLGTGYSSITLATDNDYLRALGEVGLVGALAFLLIILRVFENLISFIKNAKHDWKYGFIVGYSGGLVGILVNASFIDVFEASKVAIIFWLLTGIAMGIVDRRSLKERINES
ncbi:MAG: hypothetical protein A2782_03425 [Candidatus Blackburnbacteria bacterium RIFCSPHIGHO2_01_FULL_43_15b]|uniref:O-antigen ligase-related domain-containing protein n=1 Tax=Candidatus Blackburnbacteria bacterium RIFCSPHIGHO2_01_FULL_43_15b TaxID=1797513 RepID=A0A1G1V2F0_9BACT|nr:MAG: hypothetical protein A2782_03425 [Candidatus Blackburnbacteria bacterium RIFCSPHIGHO2_01_FULL_43_15b]